MYVLVDSEWIENTPGRFMPTQLAAIRVDGAWNTISSFSRLCRPRKSMIVEWKHIAFSGSTPADFLAAPTAFVALSDFCNWLLPEDVLLWWDDEPQRCFAQMLKAIKKQQITNESLSVRAAFKHFVCDGVKTSGNVYELAFLRGIPLLSPAHDSRNDVQMLQSLLKCVGFQSEMLYMPIPAQTRTCSTKQGLSQPYQLDVERNIIHKKGCSALSRVASVKGSSKLDAFMKNKATPCPLCCKSEWMETLHARNQDIMKRSECHYFFLPTGRVFHRPTCCIIQNAIDPPRGVMYYHTAVAAGYTPCKRCIPSVDNGPQRNAKARADASAILPGTEEPLEPALWNISLTWAEQQAIKRHEQASKEHQRKKATAMDPQENADFHTLTSTRYAFWAARGYSNFHKRNCSKLNSLKDLTGFACYSDAIRAGYQPCRQCRPSEKDDAILSIPLHNQIRSKESIDSIIALCQRKGYQCSYDYPEMTIETPVGRWIVNVVKRPVFVEHQHKEISGNRPSALHWQNRMFLSLTDLVLYIEKHDSKLMARLSDELL